MRLRKKAASTASAGSKVQTRARICDFGLYAACASTLPALSRTSSVSPAVPPAFSTAPEKIQGWRRLSELLAAFLQDEVIHFFFARGCAAS